MNRRTFLRWSLGTAVGIPMAGAGYGLVEAAWLCVRPQEIAVPCLPPAFEGMTVAFAADFHHGIFTGLAFIQKTVSILNGLNADVIALGGDFTDNNGPYLKPCLNALAELRAPLGVYCVLGNHDHLGGPGQVHRALHDRGLHNLTNQGCWLERGADRLRLGGVDDLMYGEQDLDTAVGNIGPDEKALLLSHNPDYAETLDDPRVGLMLSGHLHGGQIGIPAVWAPSPSLYGSKYLSGLVQAPQTQVFVTRGVGVARRVPIRIGSYREVNLLTLTSA
jgi:predicted MPP superfamily phosphohydrolase